MFVLMTLRDPTIGSRFVFRPVSLTLYLSRGSIAIAIS